MKFSNLRIKEAKMQMIWIKKTFYQKILFVCLVLSQTQTFAGERVENDYIDENGQYELAMKHFPIYSGDRILLTDKFIAFIKSLIEATDERLLFDTLDNRPKYNREPKRLYNADEFTQKTFHINQEIRLVDKKELSCDDYIEFSEATKKSSELLSCRVGEVILIDKEIFPHLDVLQFALLMIHEAIHKYDSSYSHLQIIDLIRAIRAIDKYVTRELHFGSIPLEVKNAFLRYPRRVQQLLKMKEFETIHVTDEGYILVGDSKLETRDLPDQPSSQISIGSVINVQAYISNAQLNNVILDREVEPRMHLNVWGDFYKNRFYRIDIKASSIDRSKIFVYSQKLSVDKGDRKTFELEESYFPKEILEARGDTGWINEFPATHVSIVDSQINDSKFRAKLLIGAKVEACESPNTYIIYSECINSSFADLLNLFNRSKVVDSKATKLDARKASSVSKLNYRYPVEEIDQLGSFLSLQSTSIDDLESEASYIILKDSFVKDSNFRVELTSAYKQYAVRLVFKSARLDGSKIIIRRKNLQVEEELNNKEVIVQNFTAKDSVFILPRLDWQLKVKESLGLLPELSNLTLESSEIVGHYLFKNSRSPLLISNVFINSHWNEKEYSSDLGKLDFSKSKKISNFSLDVDASTHFDIEFPQYFDGENKQLCFQGRLFGRSLEFDEFDKYSCSGLTDKEGH